jgi:hypothetical protein
MGAAFFMRDGRVQMLQEIKRGEQYWADVDGKATKVRVVEQSRELPHLWLSADPNGKYILVRDTAFHRIGGIGESRRGEGSD